MSYIGNNLQVAYPSYRVIDDISSGFNGVLKTFALRVAGSTPVPFPINPQQCLISVNSVIQKPDSTGASGFTLTGNNIVFATAPTAGWSFFGTVLAGADYVNVGANFPAGTAAVPSVTFDESTGTGLFLASSNVLGIATGGVQRLVVNSSGFVGIGTSSPAGTLDVRTAVSAFQAFIGTNSGTSANDAGVVFQNTPSATASSRSSLVIFDANGANASGGDYFYISNTGDNVASIWNQGGGPIVFGRSSTESLRIDSSGRLGIGTSSPSYLLDLAGAGVAAGATQSLLQLRSASDASANSVEMLLTPLISGQTKTAIGAQRSGASSNAELYFAVAGNERARIDSSGRVGIGTSSPTSGLHLANATAGSAANFTLSNSANNWNIRTGTTENALVFVDNQFTAERARIDSSGRLLVGTSSARTTYLNNTASASFQIEGIGDGTGEVALTRNASTTSGAILMLAKSKGTSAGSHTLVASGDQMGWLSFQGADGTDLVEGASIQAYVDGTPGANDMPGRLVFSTTADGAASPTERMRINSSGQVLIGTTVYGSAGTSFTNLGTQVLYNNNSSDTGVSLWMLSSRAADTGRQFLYFQANVAVTPTVVFQVLNNGNTQNANGSFTSTSDARLKENIVDANSQWNDIKAIKIRNWNFKEETGLETHRQIGPVAQELELICPGLVSETFDRDDDGNNLDTATKGVNQSVLYMKAVKALQEAMERIEALESDVALLKGT